MRRLSPLPLSTLLIALAALAAGLIPSSRPGAQTSQGRSSDNLLPNAGFESGGLFTPSSWDTTTAGLPTVLFYWDPDIKRSGERSAAIVNAGDMLPLWHNWNHMIEHAGRFAGRDLELSVWVRSAQMGGRGYLMLQCYRDTVTLYARDQGIPRDRARKLLGFQYADDPQLELGWAREYFSSDFDDWTLKKVRVH